MKPIQLKLPEGASVVGELFLSYNEVPELLNQDVLLVSLATGFKIDVGWRPEYEPNGRFVIAVYRDHYEDQIGRPAETSNPVEAAEIVEDLADRFSKQMKPQLIT